MKKQWLALAALVVVAIVIITVVAMTLRSPQPRQVTVSPAKSKRLLDTATSRPAGAVDVNIVFADNPTPPPRTRFYFKQPIRPVAGLPAAGELAQLSPGMSRVDLSDFPDGDHVIYVIADGHAPQWRMVRIRNKEIVDGMTHDVTLYPSQYATIRWAFNTSGKPELTGPNVSTGRIAMTHFGRPRYFGMDWQLWQAGRSREELFGGVPMLQFHRISQNMGFRPADDGETFDTMTVAPENGYAPKSLEAKPGLLLYCRVEGNTPRPGDRGYGKIYVESLSTTRPTGIEIAEQKFP
jgi:hypothetical protein